MLIKEDVLMTKDEATIVMMDVALHRKPHSRAEIKMAKEVLDPVVASGVVDPSDEVHRAEAAVAAQVQADAHAEKLAGYAEKAAKEAAEAKAQAAAVGKPAPAPEPEPVLFEA
jgi:hypothetical protein